MSSWIWLAVGIDTKKRENEHFKSLITYYQADTIWLFSISIGKDYELRSYPGAKWVQTKLTAASRADVSSSMFRSLFNYITGRVLKLHFA